MGRYAQRGLKLSPEPDERQCSVPCKMLGEAFEPMGERGLRALYVPACAVSACDDYF